MCLLLHRRAHDSTQGLGSHLIRVLKDSSLVLGTWLLLIILVVLLNVAIDTVNIVWSLTFFVTAVAGVSALLWLGEYQNKQATKDKN